MDEKEQKFTYHNFYADYQYTAAYKQKANGEVQLGELKVKLNDENQLVDKTFDTMIKLYKTGKSKGLKMLSPFEKGREPE